MSSVKWQPFYFGFNVLKVWCHTYQGKLNHWDLSHLTLKHRETHGCVVSIVAPDALVLKHQAISTHNAD